MIDFFGPEKDEETLTFLQVVAEPQKPQDDLYRAHLSRESQSSSFGSRTFKMVVKIVTCIMGSFTNYVYKKR